MPLKEINCPLFFTDECARDLILICFDTPEIQAYSRLLPFSIRERIPLIRVHDLPKASLLPRVLNSFEETLFLMLKPEPVKALPQSNTKSNPTESVICDLKEFKKRMVHSFGFDLWALAIPWDRFILAGGSVLHCLLSQVNKLNILPVSYYHRKSLSFSFSFPKDMHGNEMKNETKFSNKRTLELNKSCFCFHSSFLLLVFHL